MYYCFKMCNNFFGGISFKSRKRHKNVHDFIHYSSIRITPISNCLLIIENKKKDSSLLYSLKLKRHDQKMLFMYICIQGVQKSRI